MRAARKAMATSICSQLPPWACRLTVREGDSTGFECTACGWQAKSAEFVGKTDLLRGCALEDAQQAAGALFRAQRLAFIADMIATAIGCHIAPPVR